MKSIRYGSKLSLVDRSSNFIVSCCYSQTAAAVSTTANSTTADSTTADSTTADSTTADSTTADSTTAASDSATAEDDHSSTTNQLFFESWFTAAKNIFRRREKSE
jgi:hypothetical protein